MGVVITIFMIVAALFAFGTAGYVVVDYVIEKKNEEKPQEEQAIPVPAPVGPVVVPVVVPPAEEEPEPEVMPAIVEHIDAEEADAMISDDLAMETAKYESGAGHGRLGIINIGVLDRHFEANAVITLAILKEKGLMHHKVGRMKVLADGILNKPLIVKSEGYSIEAIKMIELTGGTVIILKD